MSQTMSARRGKRRQSRMPLGMLTALITACVVTLIGVFSGLEPYVVLVRAAASGILLGTLVSSGVSIIHLANVENQSRKEVKSPSKKSN